MARSFGEILKSLGVGVKSPEQLERERDPVLDKQFKRQMPTAEDYRISREYRAKKARERELARTKPADDGEINVTGTVQQPVPERQMGQWTTATAPVMQDMGQGGYGQGGLFSDAQTPKYGPLRDGYGMMTPREKAVTEQAPNIFGDYVASQDYTPRLSPRQEAANVFGVSPENFVDPGNFSTRNERELTPRKYFDALNKRFQGDRTVDLPPFLDSMLSGLFPEGLDQATTIPESATAGISDAEANRAIDIAATFGGGGTIPQPKFRVEDAPAIDFEKQAENAEKARIESELRRRRDPDSLYYGTATVTPEEVEAEYLRRNPEIAARKFLEQKGYTDKDIPDPFGGTQNYMDALPEQFDLTPPPAVTSEVKQPDVSYDAFGNVIESPEYFVSSSSPQLVDKVYDMSDPSDRVEMRQRGYLFYGDQAIDKAEEVMGRKLSAIEKNIVRDEGFSTVAYKDKGGKAIGVGQTKEYFTEDTKDLGKKFTKAIKDKQDMLKKKFGDAYPKSTEKQAALLNLAYRGDVYPKWTKKFKEGKLKEAQQEFWNNDEYRTLLQEEARTKRESPILKRVRRNEERLFGRRTAIPFVRR